IEAGTAHEAGAAEPRQDPFEPTRPSSARTRWLAAAAIVVIATSIVAVALRATRGSDDVDVVGPASTATTEHSTTDFELESTGTSAEVRDLADSPYANLGTKAAVWTGSSLIL